MSKVRFEKAKARILAAAANPTTNQGDTFVSARTISDFCGLTVGAVYNQRRAMGVVTIKDNQRKSDNGLGMLMVSRKIPVTELGAFVRVRGQHNTLRKHVNHRSVRQQINSVLEFINQQA